MPLLAVAIWVAYAPAMNRVFAGDQLGYFQELPADRSLAAGLAHYDYAVTRQFEKGDDSLFRPVFFVWLALAQWLFTYHHVWWNLAHLVLHLCVATCLYRLLLTMRPSPAALGGALIFAVSLPTFELATWHHLGGYLMAWSTGLVGLRAIVGYLDGDGSGSAGGEWTYAVAFSIAVFAHELMVLLACLLPAVVAWRAWRLGRLTPRLVGLMAAPLLVFAVFYAGHLQRAERFRYVDRPEVEVLFAPGWVVPTVRDSLHVLWVWTTQAARPSATSIDALVYNRMWKTIAFDWSEAWHRADVYLAAAFVVLVAVSLSLHQLRRVGLLVGVLGAVLLGFAAMVVVGRAHENAVTVVYYQYFFAVLGVVIVYALVDPARLGRRGRLAFVIVLAGLFVSQGRATRRNAVAMGEVNEPASAYLSAVGRFVDAHRGEPDFRFTIEGRPHDLDPALDVKLGYPDDPTTGLIHPRVTEVLFRPYLSSTAPTHVFRWP